MSYTSTLLIDRYFMKVMRNAQKHKVQNLQGRDVNLSGADSKW